MRVSNKTTFLRTVVILMATYSVSAQEGFGTNTPNPSAVVDMVASDKGMLIPRVSLTGRDDTTTIQNPAHSLLVYNTASAGTPLNVSPGFYYFDSPTNQWKSLMQDLHFLGNGNHVTVDAGVGGNGTSLGDGSKNISIGEGTLSSIMTGNENIAIGKENLLYLDHGNGNIVLGNRSLFDITGGQKNIVIGSNSGGYIIDRNNNIIIGNNIAGIYDESNTLNITNLIWADLDSQRVGVGNSFFGVIPDNGFKETFNVSNGSIYIRDINDATYQGDIVTDRIVVADADGILKSVEANSLTNEPWRVQGSTTVATDNTQNIYQMGSVAIGTDQIPSFSVGSTTINPAFHVEGDIATSGKIWTTSSVYADYVFEDYFDGFSKIYNDYKFKTLKEVAAFIKENKHLPGVTPISDVTVGKSGYTIDLTQLSMQQLEKLEELYLHVIEQQVKLDLQSEKIESQQKLIDSQQKRLDQLEAKLMKLESLLNK